MKILKGVSSFLILFFIIGHVFITDSFAKKKDVESEQQAQSAQAPGRVPIQPFQGEITDDMMIAFLKADTKIRILRQQIGQQTQAILESEKLQPEVYVAIVQKSRQDATFLERLREKAAELATTEMGN